MEKQMQEGFDNAEISNLVEQFLAKGATFKDLRGLTEQEMEAVYSLAHTYYNNGKYKEALDIFRFLCFYDHLEKRWWMGLAATCQMLKDYEKALESYLYTVILDSTDPIPQLHSAECLMALNQFEQAESALNTAIHLAGDETEFEPVKTRSQTLLKLISNRTEDKEV